MKEIIKKIDKILLIVALIFIIGGFCVFSYPKVSNYLAEKNQIEAIREYKERIVEIDENKLKEEREKARIYNENLSGDPVHDPFIIGSGYALPENYMEVLNFSNDGVMADIEIPKISVSLPIYHGTSDIVLEKGVGHIESTSVPIGGKSTLSVLTGHTGLPSAELFTRLDELVVGDIFYINVLNEILTYKVYETKVILPDQISELQIVEGKDLVTLVTCTPYGVNTHRLLVKAERTEYEEYIPEDIEAGSNSTSENKTEKKSKNYYLIGIEIGVVVFCILLNLVLIFIFIKNPKKVINYIKKFLKKK